MRYIVTGAQRSGTSMMMKALMEGGLPVYYNEEHEKRLREDLDESVNPTGYWETTPHEQLSLRFPIDVVPEGSVFKSLSPWTTLPKFVPDEYRVVLMFRDPREVILSFRKIGSGVITIDDYEVLINYPLYITKALELLKNRRDVKSLVFAEYQNILEEPEKFFATLVKYGWPINPEKAAATIMYRPPMFKTPFPEDVKTEIEKMGPEFYTLRELVLNNKIEHSFTEKELEKIKEGAEVNAALSIGGTNIPLREDMKYVVFDEDKIKEVQNETND